MGRIFDSDFFPGFPDAIHGRTDTWVAKNTVGVNGTKRAIKNVGKSR
jgi:hypothetical protein